MNMKKMVVLNQLMDNPKVKSNEGNSNNKVDAQLTKSYTYTPNEARQNTLVIKGVNALMAFINLLFVIVLMVCFTKAENPTQLVIFGGMSIFNLFLAVLHGIGIVFAKFLSGEHKSVKKLLDEEELDYSEFV